MRRALIGFTLRLVIATGISLLVWWLAVTPFDRLPFPPRVIVITVRTLDFPVALAGELLLRGTWCDFCSPGEMFLQQMRIAIPTYLLLLYVPSIIRAMVTARRRSRPDEAA